MPNLSDQLAIIRQQLQGIDSKYSTSEAFQRYQIRTNSSGKVVGKPISKKRAVPNKKTGTVSKRVEWFQKFVTMKQVVRKFKKNIDCNYIKYFLLKYLESSGMDFVLTEFEYQKSIHDVFAVQSNRAIEFEIKLSVEDYLNDFGKVYYLGAQPVNKHSVLLKGESLINRFYFVVPENMIDIDECPDHAGLIWFKEAAIKRGSKTKIILFTVVKYPPMLHTRYIPPMFYHTMAKRLYIRNKNLVSRYLHSKFDETFKKALNESAAGNIPGHTSSGIKKEGKTTN